MFLDYIKDDGEDDLFNDDVDDTISLYRERLHKAVHSAFKNVRKELHELKKLSLNEEGSES